jgi:small-conductance mechanosensitive channel
MAGLCSSKHRWLFPAIVILTFSIVPWTNSQTRSHQKKTDQRGQSSPQPSPPVTPSAPTIATPQVAAEAIQLAQQLRSMPDRIISNEALAELEQQITALAETTNEKARKTEEAIQSGAIFTELQQSSLDWEAMSKDLRSRSQTLTKHATSLENELTSLRSAESHWLATTEAVKSQKSPPELLDLTGRTLTEIDAAVKSVEERRSRIVTLQQSLATQAAIIATEIQQLKKAVEQSQRSLLEPDSLPLWKVQGGSQTEESVGHLLRTTNAQDLTRLKSFLYTKRTPLLIVTLLTISALAIFLRLGRRSNATAASNLERETSVLRRPFSLALLVFLVAMMGLLYDAPNIAISAVNLIGTIPTIRLLLPRVTKPFQKLLLALIASVLFWALIKLLAIPVWIKRDLIAVFTLIIISLCVWLALQARRSDIKLHGGPTLTLFVVFGGILFLMTAFVANLFGYIGLSDLVTQGTLASAYRGANLYTAFVVGGLLISYLLHTGTEPKRGVTLRTNRDKLARRLIFALGVTVVLVWIHSTLKLFTVREGVYAAIISLLNYQIKIGSASFEVSNFVAFVLTLIIGYLVASVIRAILSEEILPRLTLAHGLPNAIATITHYVLMVLIFFFALAAAGVELSKFTILTGAVGVGLGFGLQSVVNNFVSGLILLFERPVRVGDLLEVKGVSGQVTKIGFRSSTLHAYDGADVIVPNATLISEQVTNWTLTGTRRLIVLNVHVAYGNDPTEVRDLLHKTVAGQSDLLNVPAPTVLFLGFGDNALNFEVRFWAPQPEVVPELKSEVALSIARALSEAGIKVPAPQQLQITGLEQDRTPEQKKSGAAGG